MKSTENSRGTAKNTGRTAKNLMWIYSMEWQGLTGADESPPSLWTGQGDAAAEVDEDQESGGGGGARATAQ